MKRNARDIPVSPPTISEEDKSRFDDLNSDAPSSTSLDKDFLFLAMFEADAKISWFLVDVISLAE